MNSSKLMTIAVILAVLTSTEVNACRGESCKIGTPTMCRLYREETSSATGVTHHRIPDGFSSTRRRLVMSSDTKTAEYTIQYKGRYYKSQSDVEKVKEKQNPSSPYVRQTSPKSMLRNGTVNRPQDSCIQWR